MGYITAGRFEPIDNLVGYVWSTDSGRQAPPF